MTLGIIRDARAWSIANYYLLLRSIKISLPLLSVQQNNYDFNEKYTDRYTIRRYYDDGWILEYKVDETGRSISDSFRWIEKK